MDSIRELRKICQSTRPSIYGDFLSQFYYRVSIYFTWVALKLKMTANQVSVLSGLVVVVGGALLASKSAWLVLVGAVCFHVFNILDMSDGEVARYNKESSITGHFLDWYMHFIWSAAFFIGLTFGALQTMNKTFIVFSGFFALISSIMDKSIVNSGWTVISWARLRVMMTGKEIVEGCEGFVGPRINGAASASNKDVEKAKSKLSSAYLLKRIVFLLTLLIQDHWIVIALSLFAFVHVFIAMTSWISFDFRPFWVTYAGAVAPIYVFFKVKRLVKKKAFEDGYRRLYANPNPIKLPEDDFFN